MTEEKTADIGERDQVLLTFGAKLALETRANPKYAADFVAAFATALDRRDRIEREPAGVVKHDAGMVRVKFSASLNYGCDLPAGTPVYLASAPERVEATTSWPAGCVKPNSCGRHKQCMYAKCKNEGRDICSEVEAALASREAT